MSQARRAIDNARRLAAPGARPRFSRRLALGTGLALAAALAFGGPLRARGAGGATAQDHSRMVMSGEAMRARADAYWAVHERVGSASRTLEAAPAATFTVNNFFFDDGAAGQVDTAQILVGESVMWQWIAGTHTITSGTGTSDPSMGSLFNQPSDVSNQQFTFTFGTAGTYPFFCQFHELSNMKGVVVVTDPTGVGPPSGSTALGFIRGPAPNPTRSGTVFHFALPTGGHARADVFDASGRRVAVILDDDLAAGPHTASWNGRTPTGLAGTGVYYVRLRLPGYDQSRQIVVRR